MIFRNILEFNYEIVWQLVEEYTPTSGKLLVTRIGDGYGLRLGHPSHGSVTINDIESRRYTIEEATMHEDSLDILLKGSYGSFTEWVKIKIKGKTEQLRSSYSFLGLDDLCEICRCEE